MLSERRRYNTLKCPHKMIVDDLAAELLAARATIKEQAARIAELEGVCGSWARAEEACEQYVATIAKLEARIAAAKAVPVKRAWVVANEPYSGPASFAYNAGRAAVIAALEAGE